MEGSFFTLEFSLHFLGELCGLALEEGFLLLSLFILLSVQALLKIAQLLIKLRFQLAADLSLHLLLVKLPLLFFIIEFLLMLSEDLVLFDVEALGNLLENLLCFKIQFYLLLLYQLHDCWVHLRWLRAPRVASLHLLALLLLDVEVPKVAIERMLPDLFRGVRVQIIDVIIFILHCNPRVRHRSFEALLCDPEQIAVCGQVEAEVFCVVYNLFRRGLNIVWVFGSLTRATWVFHLKYLN